MSRERFAVLLYGMKTAEQMRQAFAKAVEKPSGFIYITDRTAAMPWGGLPTYWNDEIDAAILANKGPANKGKDAHKK